MFEVAELGRSVDKETFKQEAQALRTRLIAAQQRLRGSNIPVVVVVSGVEGAGKTEVVNRLSEWLDTRGLQTHSFWETSDEERERPRFWRFWRRLPPRGAIGVMFGSWYTEPIVGRVTSEDGPEADALFERRLAHIARFERLLTLDGALIVKLWFHLSEGALRARIAADDAELAALGLEGPVDLQARSGEHGAGGKDGKRGKKGKKGKGRKKAKKRDRSADKAAPRSGGGRALSSAAAMTAAGEDWGALLGAAGQGRSIKPWHVSPLARRFLPSYRRFAGASERAIRATDSGACRWHLIEATDRNYRDLAAARVLLEAIEARLAAQEARAEVQAELRTSAELRAGPSTAAPAAALHQPTILSRVDLSSSLSRKAYKRRLAEAQRRLYDLSWHAWREKVPTVCVFEGWDAAGKGGAIRRLTAGVDARLFRTIPIAAPTDEEHAQHYLWRFWRQLPPDGRIRIYDRSWYGRVLVERVEGFATADEWQRAYQEINDFEEELVEHGTALAKLWLHISPEEQLARFEERKLVPWKKHKITDEDWRNRDKWGAYETAVNDMVARTSTSRAPWTLVPGDDKKFARVMVVETVCDALEAALARR